MSELKGDFGFIGLGMMGYGMALNVRKKIPSTSKLFVYDISEAALKRFQAEADGEVVIASSSKDVVDHADTVITMLPEGAHVKAAFLTPETGALATSSKSKKLFLDCSTIDAASSLEVGKAVQKSGIGEFSDTPVSGGVAGANAGTLAFMFGSSEALVPRIIPVLSLMGVPARLFHCGPPGTGLAAKLANNYLAGTVTIATSEAFNLGIRMGLDPKKLADIIAVSTGKNWISENANPVPGVLPNAASSHDYQGGFRVALCKKDIGLALEAAKMVDAKLAIGPKVFETYENVCKDPELVTKDVTVVYRYIGGVEK